MVVLLVFALIRSANMLDYGSFPDQRQAYIHELLLAEGRVSCAHLSKELEVSEHTIRRDLQELSRLGVCKRVHGGAVSISPASGSVVTRTNENLAEKELLAETCVNLIQPGACIFIDAGSSNLAIVRAIPRTFSVTAVTNAPAIALELAKIEGCEVILLGGLLSQTTGAATGIAAQEQMRNIYFDQCLLGVCALDTAAGLTAFDYADAEFKRLVVVKSNELIVAATSDKIPSIARYHVADTEDVTHLVVASSLAPEKITHFQQCNITVHLAHNHQHKELDVSKYEPASS